MNFPDPKEYRKMSAACAPRSSILRNGVFAFLIGGGICGLAGLIQAAGVNHTLNDQMGNGMGYTAVAIAYMAQMEPAAIVVVSFLFSILLQGSSYMQISMPIPSATGDVIQGIILLFILGSEFFSRYRVTWDRKEKEAAK